MSKAHVCMHARLVGWQGWGAGGGREGAGGVENDMEPPPLATAECTPGACALPPARARQTATPPPSAPPPLSPPLPWRSNKSADAAAAAGLGRDEAEWLAGELTLAGWLQLEFGFTACECQCKRLQFDAPGSKLCKGLGVDSALKPAPSTSHML